jgi:hypothetical protein
MKQHAVSYPVTCLPFGAPYVRTVLSSLYLVEA